MNILSRGLHIFSYPRKLLPFSPLPGRFYPEAKSLEAIKLCKKMVSYLEGLEITEIVCSVVDNLGKVFLGLAATQ